MSLSKGLWSGVNGKVYTMGCPLEELVGTPARDCDSMSGCFYKNKKIYNKISKYINIKIFKILVNQKS